MCKELVTIMHNLVMKLHTTQVVLLVIFNGQNNKEQNELIT